MIQQSLVQSGFDVEALLGEQYLTAVLVTALDAGLIPPRTELADPHLIIKMYEPSQPNRLYEATLPPDGLFPDTTALAFDVEILFDHPLGADLRVHVMMAIEQVSTGIVFPVEADLFLTLALATTRDEAGDLADVGIAVHVVDIASSVLPILAADPYFIPKEQVLERVQALVDRTLDIGGASSFKRVEDIAFKKHAPDGDHPPAIGLYVNVRLRNGDEEDAFVDPRGDLEAALNFLPAEQDMAFASRPGLFAQMGKDTYHRTAFKNDLGWFEHALRKSMFNPKSKRIGTVNSVSVQQLEVAGVPVNGLRIRVAAEWEPDQDVNTDVDFTIDIVPSIDGDGLLKWSVELNVSVDALFEFLTVIGFAFLAITFGPAFGFALLGALFVAQVGAGIYLEERFQDKVSKRADATLTDVILDRLTIKKRRWDPFYATLHQVVTKPTQAEFNSKGFMLCGKAFVGREIEPPADTVLRDDIRDANGALVGLRYGIPDYEAIQEDLVGYAPGLSRREFTYPDPVNDPALFGLTLEQIQARFDDEEGPLLLQKIPVFPAMVYLRDHQINQLLCICGSELADILGVLRTAASERKYAEIVANESDAIRAQVIEDLDDGDETTPPPTEEEIAAEVEARIQGRLSELMRDYEAPTPLQLAFTHHLKPVLRFDVSSLELAMLQDKQILVLDNLDVVRPGVHRRYIRDEPDWGQGGERDNLMKRPRYRPSPAGPVYP